LFSVTVTERFSLRSFQFGRIRGDAKIRIASAIKRMRALLDILTDARHGDTGFDPIGSRATVAASCYNSWALSKSGGCPKLVKSAARVSHPGSNVDLHSFGFNSQAEFAAVCFRLPFDGSEARHQTLHFQETTTGLI